MSGRTTALNRARMLRGALLEFGVPEVSIEIQQGRPSSGDRWNACRPVGVMSHHIASHPSASNPTPGLSLVKRGRIDLGGPLANGYGGMDLAYRILTMGLANHPGVGGPMTLRGPLGSYRIPANIGRPYLWGTEFEGGYSDSVWDATYTNRRTGMSMTYREFMGRVNAGLTYGIWLINGRGREPKPEMDLATYHVEHSTWTSRKIDRRNYSTAKGRNEIREYKEADMALSDDDVKRVVKELLNTDISNKGEPKMTVRRALRQASNAPRTVRQEHNKHDRHHSDLDDA